MKKNESIQQLQKAEMPTLLSNEAGTAVDNDDLFTWLLYDASPNQVYNDLLAIIVKDQDTFVVVKEVPAACWKSILHKRLAQVIWSFPSS